MYTSRAALSLLWASTLVFKTLGQDVLVCPDGYTQVHVSTNVVAYPVVINQFFGSNTIININGFGEININNAPVTFVTTITATTTTTATTTVTVLPTLPAGVIGPAVVLAVQPAGVVKRQNGASSGYVDGTGQRTFTCASAQQFFLNGTRLQAVGSQDVVSYETGTDFATFVPVAQGTANRIDTAFATPGNVVNWANPAFNGGIAAFYFNTVANLIEAVVTATADLTNLSPINLLAVPAASCVDIQSSSSSSSASVPTTSVPTTSIPTTSVPTTSVPSTSSTSTTDDEFITICDGTIASSSTTSSGSSSISSDTAATLTSTSATETNPGSQLTLVAPTSTDPVVISSTDVPTLTQANPITTAPTTTDVVSALA